MGHHDGKRTARPERPSRQRVAAFGIDPVERGERDDPVMGAAFRLPVLEVRVDDLHPRVARELTSGHLRQARADLDTRDLESPLSHRRRCLSRPAADLDDARPADKTAKLDHVVDHGLRIPWPGAGIQLGYLVEGRAAQGSLVLPHCALHIPPF